MTEFQQSLLEKWETKHKLKARGELEMTEDAIMPYWDDKFVRDLLAYTEVLYLRSEELKKGSEECLEELAG